MLENGYNITPHLDMNAQLFTEPLTMVLKSVGNRVSEIRQDGKKRFLKKDADKVLFDFNLYGVMIQYVGELGNVFAIIRDSFIQLSGEGQLIAQIIWNLFCIFVGWIEVVMVGYLAVIGSRTILRNSKYAGGISIVAFFGITFIIEKIYNLISNVLPNVEVEGDSFFGVGYPAYYIIICVIVFLLSGWMADKKLSV